MEVMKSDPENDSEQDAKTVDSASSEGSPAEDGKNNMFSEEMLAQDSELPDPRGDGKPPMTVSAADKVAFIDSVVANSRFTKEYSLFGGRLKVTMRSLTSDEVNALAVWTAKQGTKDASGGAAVRDLGI